jgi:BRCT domain type II-containing protein
MASQAIESGERRVVQFVRLPSTPKASTSKASTSKARKLKASTPKAWGCATSAQLPKCLPNVLQLGGG